MNRNARSAYPIGNNTRGAVESQRPLAIPRVARPCQNSVPLCLFVIPFSSLSCLFPLLLPRIVFKFHKHQIKRSGSPFFRGGDNGGEKIGKVSLADVPDRGFVRDGCHVFSDSYVFSMEFKEPVENRICFSWCEHHQTNPASLVSCITFSLNARPSASLSAAGFGTR